MFGSGNGSERPANEVGENSEAAVAAAATLYNWNGLTGYTGSEWTIYLKRVPSTSMLPGDSGRCWVGWLLGSESGGVVGVVESDGASDNVPIVESTAWPRGEPSTNPSPSMVVFLLLSLNMLAGRRMIEDNPRLFRFPEYSPVGVGGRDRAEPENRPLFGREEVVGNTVPLGWELLLLLLDVDPVSIVLTTP